MKDYAALSSLISVTVFNEAVSCIYCSAGKHFKFLCNLLMSRNYVTLEQLNNVCLYTG